MTVGGVICFTVVYCLQGFDGDGRVGFIEFFATDVGLLVIVEPLPTHAPARRDAGLKIDMPADSFHAHAREGGIYETVDAMLTVSASQMAAWCR